MAHGAPRIFITKSKSGHYGCTARFAGLSFTIGKLDTVQAARAARCDAIEGLSDRLRAFHAGQPV